MIIHVVQPGETISLIAKSYGLSVEQLIQENGLTNADDLVIGQAIVIVYPKQTYTVRKGDTVSTIAETNGVTVSQLLRNNPQITNDDSLYESEIIIISYDVEKIGKLTTNGYTYPFIDRKVLKKTLPYLTYLTIFAYGFTPAGELIPVDDSEIIQIAREYGVAPIMLVSSIVGTDLYQTDYSHALLINQDSKERLIDNIIITMKAKGYYSLNIDFGFNLRIDKQAYVDFIARVTDRLNQEGFEVMVTIAIKESTQMHDGHDYKGLGEVANKIMLIRYEWGYTFGPPMAITPYYKARIVLDFAVTQIPPEKINISILKYAYDWELPYVPGVTMAQSLGNVAAIELAAQVNTIIQYDEDAQAPFYYYVDNNTDNPIQHVVWFDDARSINVKVYLVPLYGFEGVGVWNIMSVFPQMWLVINIQYDIIKVL